LNYRGEREEYIEDMANRVNYHKCRRGYGGCLKIINGKEKCKRGYPKPARDKTTIVFEKKKNKHGHISWRIKVEPKRPEHCTRINQFCETLFLMVKANCNVQLLPSEAEAEYVCKY
jgi:hypothetical protein